MVDPRRLVMLLSLSASMVMLMGKGSAYLITQSAAILSDAIESLVHGVATSLAAFSLWYSGRPADSNHPYGHGRIAYFSAGFEGALVLIAGCAVVGSGVFGLWRPPELTHLGIGLFIQGALAAVNLVLGIALVRVGKQHDELILVANGKHVLSDMWTTVAAIVGVALVMLTGRPWFDSVAALLIGLWIVGTGIALLRRSFAGLMDEADPESSRVISEILRQSVEGGDISAYHQLRHREVNGQLWVDVHMLVPGTLSLQEAHARVTAVERKIEAGLRGTTWITTHIEPLDHAKAHPGGHATAADPLAPS